jgi:predicted dehydrogenase
MAEFIHLKRTALSRRSFLKSTAAIGAVAPYYVPASVFGSSAPSNRINLACIGVGNQGYAVMQRFLKYADCQVVAVCDVNAGSHGYRDADQFRGREPAKQEVERHYAEEKGTTKYKGCDSYTDYREVLARNDVDAVLIASPDHWHDIMVITAAEAGKDIYCEKPLGLTIAGQQKMVAAVRKHNRILQTGSMERSNAVIRRVCELVRGGAIGEVKRVLCHVARHNKVGPGPGWQPMPVPAGFDYNLWLGPAPDAPYHQDRCLYRFRFIYDYSGGQITNFGAHTLDIAQWALGTDGTGPTEIEHVYADYPPEGSLFNAATYTHFRCRYKNGTVLECFTGDPAARVMFEGTEGMMRVDSNGESFFATPSKIWPDDLKRPARYTAPEAHVRNFLDCVKSRSEPAAPVEVGHRSATICHLGNIAIKLQSKLTWDPAAERFTGGHSDDANARLTRSAREPWTV